LAPSAPKERDSRALAPRDRDMAAFAEEAARLRARYVSTLDSAEMIRAARDERLRR
jgi:hypothetical protein